MNEKFSEFNGKFGQMINILIFSILYFIIIYSVLNVETIFHSIKENLIHFHTSECVTKQPEISDRSIDVEQFDSPNKDEDDYGIIGFIIKPQTSLLKGVISKLFSVSLLESRSTGLNIPYEDLIGGIQSLSQKEMEFYHSHTRSEQVESSHPFKLFPELSKVEEIKLYLSRIQFENGFQPRGLYKVPAYPSGIREPYPGYNLIPNLIEEMVRSNNQLQHPYFKKPCPSIVTQVKQQEMKAHYLNFEISEWEA